MEVSTCGDSQIGQKRSRKLSAQIVIADRGDVLELRLAIEDDQLRQNQSRVDHGQAHRLLGTGVADAVTPEQERARHLGEQLTFQFGLAPDNPTLGCNCA